MADTADGANPFAEQEGTYGNLQRKIDCRDGLHVLDGHDRCIFCNRPADRAPSLLEAMRRYVAALEKESRDEH